MHLPGTHLFKTPLVHLSVRLVHRKSVCLRLSKKPRLPPLFGHGEILYTFFHKNVIFFSKPSEEIGIATNKTTKMFFILGHFEDLMFL